MKAKMRSDVERMAQWDAQQLDAYVHDTGQQLKNLQHQHTAALKAQRAQRKTKGSG